ncbi:glycosyltransferase family 4 protein [soil metagenome]
MNAPNLTLVSDAHRAAGGSGDVRAVTLLGNYPPRRCGIATFTYDVREALVAARPDLACDVIAMTDEGGPYAYPPEVSYALAQDDPADYLAAAARIRENAPDVLCVQHEFGIFGGPAGEHLLQLLDSIDVPVVSTLHTILEEPNEDQRRVFERLLKRSARVIVMAERGREMLRRVWNVPLDKIVLVPHGAPDVPLVDTDEAKVLLGYEGREVLFTFGLLSPNKGIETVVQALPQIVAARPNALYVVLGATHPSLVAREGERYRDSLIEMGRELGVADNLRFVDEYTDTARLLDYLRAADVYVTPYLNAAQITSGTLSYAAALGKPVVSTAYWHAQELLADGRGALVGFSEPEAIAEEVTSLLSDPERLATMRWRIYAFTRPTVWSRLAETYLGAFARVSHIHEADVLERRRRPGRRARPHPSLAGVRRMTDSCGMMQHSLFSLPDRNHGYCVDDNARALMLLQTLLTVDERERLELSRTFATFVQHAWNREEGSFRNFMSFERAWLEERGSEDSNGRSLWALGVVAADGRSAELRTWAWSLFCEALPFSEAENHLRTDAFVVLGLAPLIQRGRASGHMRDVAVAKADHLMRALDATSSGDRRWFEPHLSYDNARLPEALIRAGQALDRPEWTRAGLEALEWLCGRQTSRGGYFRPVPTGDFGKTTQGALFDQQPLEACATIDACAAAHAVTGDPRWIAEAERAYDWYFGANDGGVSLIAGEGECYDGLTWAGANQNQGAESVLAFQFATSTLSGLLGGAHERLRTSRD